LEEDLAAQVAGAMRDCLGLGPGDKTMIFYDAKSTPVMEAISAASRLVGASPVTVLLPEDARPLTALPRGIARRIEEEKPEATFYVAGVRPGEGRFRAELVGAAMGVGASHVHMPRANLEILSKVAGCKATAGIIERLARALEGARRVSVESPAGTRLIVEVGEYRWVADTGIIPRGRWGNWPPGEVFTTPTGARGVLVVDGVLGDYFSTKYGLLGDPVTVGFDGGRIVRVEGGPVASELYEYLSRHPCGLRVGELGIGGNPRIRRPIGIMLHDEKMPGAHVAAGDPLGSATGAPWRCPVHVDMLPLETTVRAGTTTIVERGRLLV